MVTRNVGSGWLRGLSSTTNEVVSKEILYLHHCTGVRVDLLMEYLGLMLKIDVVIELVEIQ